MSGGVVERSLGGKAEGRWFMIVYVRPDDRLNSYHPLTVEMLNVWEAS
jgi:hypothetical protein